MEQIALSSVPRTLRAVRMDDARWTVSALVTMDISGPLVQLCVATQRPASTGAVARRASASVTRDLMASTAISAKRISTDHCATSSASERLCAMAMVIVMSEATVRATVAFTVRTVSRSARLSSDAAVGDIAMLSDFATVNKAFTALHVQCTVAQVRATGMAYVLRMASVSAMTVILE